MSNPVGFILTDEEIAKGQEFLLIWQNITSRPFTTRELDFARAIESAVLHKLRERPADAWMRPSVLEGCGPVTTAFADDANGWRIAGLSVQKLHIIPEEHE